MGCCLGRGRPILQPDWRKRGLDRRGAHDPNGAAGDAAVKPPAVFAGRLPRLLACLSLADWGVVALTLVLDLSLLMPWVSLAGYVIRPIDLHGAWALVGLLALIVLATVVAGRWPYTRWLALVPLGSGCLLLGVLGGVAGAVLALNPLLARLPWAEANDLAATVRRVAGFVGLNVDQLDRLSAMANRFALEPQVGFHTGCWLFAAGALALIVVGYRKIAECFVAGAVPAPPTTPVRWGASPEV
jgi:hypothetical protein